MEFTKRIVELLKEKNSLNNKLKIALVEGSSKRMITSAIHLEMEQLVDVLLVFKNREEFESAGKLASQIEYVIIEEEKELFDEFVNRFFELRKGKETLEQIQKDMKETPLFSAMLLKTGRVDGVVGGVHNSTANILRAAFKAVGPTPGVKTISSVMMMHRNDDWYIFTDISVNPNPNQAQLVDIAKNAYNFGDVINFKKKVAFLSYSTSGSAVTEQSQMIAAATKQFNEETQCKYKALGEIQFDAAFDLRIRAQKYKDDDGFKKMPTIFVFPDLNSGNIGYKIAQRMGSWGAIGPIITGLQQPMNDLSRGSTTQDVINTIILTALQAHHAKFDQPKGGQDE